VRSYLGAAIQARLEGQTRAALWDGQVPVGLRDGHEGGHEEDDGGGGGGDVAHSDLDRTSKSPQKKEKKQENHSDHARTQGADKLPEVRASGELVSKVAEGGLRVGRRDGVPSRVESAVAEDGLQVQGKAGGHGEEPGCRAPLLARLDPQQAVAEEDHEGVEVA
jgi:hypothetical protein